MRTLLICSLACLSISQVAVADYILSSGSNDTGTNGGQSIIRYTDDFQVVWERSPAKGTAETQVFALEISPLNGDVYTSQIANPQLSKHLSYADGAFIGRAVPAGGQTDGTGKYTAPGEALQDIQFGYDYNKDGVADLWVCRRDTFEVHDGTTLNRTGDTGMAATRRASGAFLDLYIETALAIDATSRPAHQPQAYDRLSIRSQHR